MIELQEKLIDNLLEIINGEIKKLKEENQNLKAMVNAFINELEKDENATEVKIFHVCKYTSLLNEYQNWLAKEKEVIYKDCGHTQNAITKCYDKLIELRKQYEE